MRRNTFVVGGLVLVAATLVVGCAKPPQQELDAAKAAMTAAEQAEAPKYAPEAWDKAQQAMNAVNAELEAQNNKFALFRSYTKAKQLIQDATTAANEAKDAGVAGKEKAKNEAQAAIDAVKSSIDAAKTAMEALEKCRRKPKDLRKDLELMKGNLDGYANQVTDIEGAFGREDYFGAKAQAESLKGQVDKMVEELQAAKTKIRC
jgi:chromosome segregation ATPase